MAKNVFDMSDEEFMKQMNEGTLTEEEPKENTPPKEEDVPPKEDGSDPKEGQPTPQEDTPKEGEEEPKNEDVPPKDNPSPKEEDIPTKEGDPKPEGEEPKPKEDDKEADKPTQEPPKVEDKPTGSEPDYKALYTSLMQPIKANGKTITIKDPKELIQLAQQGLNYTKKMQAIAPMRKLAQSLENAGLFTEDKLNYLIDLASGKKEAITKLLQEYKINPVDLDTTEPSSYKPDNHQVSDQESLFKTTLEDLKSTPEGLETINEMNSWDNKSKGILWEHPDVMATINQQRQNGVYQLISDEIARRQALGQLSYNTPFLEAYKIVGDDLLAQRQQQQAALLKQAPVAQTIPPATPAQPAATAAQVKAAAPNRATKPTTGKKLVNPFDMSDDDFVKQFGETNNY